MQVLYYSPITWSNTDFYRTTGVIPFINHPEIVTRDISHYGRITQWDLEGAQVLIAQRPSNPDHLRLIKLAKKCGLKVISDFDDDLLNVDKLNPTYSQYEAQRDFVIECALFSDEIWTSTPSIVKSFGRGIVIPNALNVALVGNCMEYNKYSNRVVWRGSAAHEADMYENSDKIVDMVKGHPELDFFFIGHRFTYLEQRCGENFNSVEGMPIMRYFSYLKELKPRMMIFPLCDTILNRGKSNISLLEATLVGANYFGNPLLPEFNLPFVNELSNFPNGTGHAEAKAYIEENLLLSKVNLLRQESLLTLAQ